MGVAAPSMSTEYFGATSSEAAYSYIEALYELLEVEYIKSVGNRTFVLTETGVQHAKRMRG